MGANMPHIAVWLIWLLGICQVMSQNVSDAKNVKTHVFGTNLYDYTVRPINDQTSTLNVSVSFYLLSINGIDEVSETLTTTGFLFIYWTDEQATWTPASFGGLTTTHFPQVFVSTCTIIITNFPFDVQTCDLVFVAWSYSKAEVRMVGDTDRGMDLSEFTPNPSWEVIATSWEADETKYESSITFTIKMKRKAQYVMLNIVFPMILLSILSVATYALPCAGGERSGYAVTIFLAFAVFLTIVESIIPENSESVAMFSIYIILLSVISTFTTVITLVECRLITWDTDVTPIPNWVKAIANIGGCVACRRACCKKGNKIRQVQPSPKQRGDKENGKPDKGAGVKDDVDDDVTECDYTWQTVVNGLDGFFFIVCASAAILTTFLFLVVTSTSASVEADSSI